jgi:hypothetical protein
MGDMGDYPMPFLQCCSLIALLQPYCSRIFSTLSPAPTPRRSLPLPPSLSLPFPRPSLSHYHPSPSLPLEYKISRFGRAAMQSGVSPDEAIMLYEDLNMALGGVNLETDLQLVYLVTPQDRGLYPDFQVRFLPQLIKY